MLSITHDFYLKAAPELVFAYLSNPRNMPLWATNFCLGYEEEDGLGRIQTPQGVLTLAIDADARSRVIDFVAGPNTAEVARWFSRIVAAPGAGSVFLFTAIQQPGQPAEAFAAQCDLLKEEFGNIRRAMDGGGANAAVAAA